MAKRRWRRGDRTDLAEGANMAATMECQWMPGVALADFTGMQAVRTKHPPVHVPTSVSGARYGAEWQCSGIAKRDAEA
jgi:hypothetical protein